MSMYYVNKKNKQVYLTATPHAIRRFIERWAIMFPETTLRNPEKTLTKWFMNAQRVTDLSRKDNTRIKRHGPSVYFRSNAFTFVVRGTNIVTVELSDKGMRHLN